MKLGRVLLLVVVLGLAYGGYRYFYAAAPGASAPGASAPGGAGAPPRRMGSISTPVVAVPVVRGGVDLQWHALGTVEASASVVVRARVDGELLALHFSDGQQVRAGDLLAELDAEPFRIELERAQGQQQQTTAQLQNARRDLARYEQLFKQDSVARQQLDAARLKVAELQAQARIDQANVDFAQMQLGYTKITAPASGRLGLRRVDVGNMLKASDADGLVVLTQTEPADVRFSLAQGRLQDLYVAQAGAQAPLEVVLSASLGAKELARGYLLAVDNQIDAATGSVQLKARFDNRAQLLFPNQFVQVALKLGRAEGLLVPLRAVQRSSSGEYVFRVRADNTVEQVAVQSGADDGELVLLAGDLAPEDRIVIEGVDRLRPGAKVDVAPAQAKP